MTVDATSLLPIAATPADLIAAGFLARYPAGTRTGYRISLRAWFGWCSSHHLDPLTATRAHIEVWARQLEEHDGYARSTVAARLNSICGFYRFATIDGHIPADPAAHVRRPKIEFVSSTQALTRGELADMLRAAEAESTTSHALVCLLGLNGLRVGETIAADIDQLSHQRGYRTIHLPNRKGGKVGTLSLSVRTSWAVDQAITGRTSGPILLGRDGDRLKVAAARRTITRLAKTIGCTKRITPHSLRHTFATMALDAGVPERDIIDSTGHSDTRMLRYYDRNRGAIERNATHAVSAFVGAA